MIKVLTSKEVKKSERIAFENGMDEKDAMFNAGAHIFDRAKDFENILVVCGLGNNGGDGFVCASLLKKIKKNVKVYVKEGKKSELASFFYEKIKDIVTDEIEGEYDLIIDALYGIGFHGSFNEEDRKIVEKINNSKSYIISADIPSGLDATTGKTDYCVKADETITFSCIKQGLLIGKGLDYCGKIICCNIGINVDSDFYFLEESDIKLNKINSSSHKGTQGHVGVIAGSLGMEGAGALCAISALRTSAGKVSLSVPEECLPFYYSRDPEIMVSVRKKIKDFVKDKDVVVFGPGIGRNDENLVKEVKENTKCPLIIDADGLYFAKDLKGTIITPHIGEASRLFNVSIKELEEDPKKYAMEFAKNNECIVILKSNYNIITDGNKCFISHFGCPGMATAGSGDVLAGIVAGALLLQKDKLEASILSSFLHGFAGRAAQIKKSEYAMTASDISENIYEGFLYLKKS